MKKYTKKTLREALDKKLQHIMERLQQEKEGVDAPSRLERCIQKCKNTMLCGHRKYKDSFGYCRNSIFCAFCSFIRAKEMMEVLDYALENKCKHLQMYIRTETFRIRDLEDWNLLETTVFDEMTYRRSRIQTTMSAGNAKLKGMINRIDIAEKYGIPVVKMTSVLLFYQKKIITMSPYWEPVTIYRKTQNGQKLHYATMKFYGEVRTRCAVKQKMQKLFYDRTKEYLQVSDNSFIRFLKLTDKRVCSSANGVLFQEYRQKTDE